MDQNVPHGARETLGDGPMTRPAPALALRSSWGLHVVHDETAPIGSPIRAGREATGACAASASRLNPVAQPRSTVTTVTPPFVEGDLTMHLVNDHVVA